MQETTGPKLITIESGDSLDNFRTALAALELASLSPADVKKLATLRELGANALARRSHQGRTGGADQLLRRRRRCVLELVAPRHQCI